MSKHSLGPWMIQDLGERSGYPNWHSFAVRTCKENVHLATVGNVDRYFEGKEKANATLMCASPDMLNALQIAKATIERLERHAPGSANGTLDVINAAITKATT